MVERRVWRFKRRALAAGGPGVGRALHLWRRCERRRRIDRWSMVSGFEVGGEAGRVSAGIL